MKNISLALAGGGIRAYAQIGVYKLLSENNIEVDSVSGTSMGSIIASLIATGINHSNLIYAMKELENDFLEKQIFLRPNLRILPFSKKKINGFVDADVFEDMIQKQFDKLNVKFLSDLKKPIALTSVDLVTGKLVVFTNKPDAFVNQHDKIIISETTITEAIRSSCSFPIVFSTKKSGNMQLVDGGVKMNLPVQLLKSMQAENIISVTMDGNVKYNASNKVLNVAFRIIDIMTSANQESDKLVSDYNLNVDVSRFNTFDAGKGDIIIDQSYNEAKNHLTNILNIIK